ncbi:MAG TPA: hypothetical protein PLX97_02820, partial [Gemmatales bacterium]|nr:hypothetical protein [Gemmatales bacterium]
DRHDSICIAAYEAAQLLLEIASSPAGLEHQARLLSAASKIMNQVNEIAPGLWSYGVGVMLERAAKTISTEQNNRHDYRR